MSGIEGIAFTRGGPIAGSHEPLASAASAPEPGERPRLGPAGPAPGDTAGTRDPGMPLGSLRTGDWLRSDRAWGDFPLDAAGNPSHPATFTPRQEQLLEVASRLSDEALFRVLGAELAVFGGELGERLGERFRADDPSEVRFGPASAFAATIRSDPEGQRVIERLETRLQSALQYQLDSRGAIDAIRLDLGVEGADLAYWAPNPLNPLSGAYGGVQGLELALIELDYDPASRRVEAVLAIDMLDTFGVGHDDFDSPGQVAMWVLQHQRGIAPFPTRTELVVEVGFTLDAPGPPRGGPMHHILP